MFGLCDVAGEPGAETTPFTNASYDCPGDDDLEHVLSAADAGRGARLDVPHHRGQPRPLDPARCSPKRSATRNGATTRPRPAARSSRARSPTTSRTSPRSTRRSRARACRSSTSGIEPVDGLASRRGHLPRLRFERGPPPRVSEAPGSPSGGFAPSGRRPGRCRDRAIRRAPVCRGSA